MGCGACCSVKQSRRPLSWLEELAFVRFASGVTVAFVSAWLGDPRLLVGAADYHARLCGDTPFSQRRYLYWPDPTNSATPVCLDRCPTRTDVVNDAAVALLRAGPPGVETEANGTKKVVFQDVWTQRVPVYATLAYPNLAWSSVRFCLREPGMVPPSGSSAARVHMRAPGGPGAVPAQLRRAVADLDRLLSVDCRWCAVAVALGLFVGGFTSLGLRCVPRFTAWSLVFAAFMLSLLVGWRWLSAASNLSMEFGRAVLDDLLSPLCRVMGTIVVLLASLWLLVTVICCRAINAAADISCLSLRLLSAEPLLRALWTVPLLCAAAQLAGVWVVLRALPWAASMASMDFVEQPESLLSNSFGGLRFVGLERRWEFYDAACLFSCLLLLYLARLWVCQVAAFARLVVALAVASWYFTAPDVAGLRRIPRGALGVTRWIPLPGCWVALRYHLGTCAARALLVAAAPMAPAALSSVAALLASSARCGCCASGIRTLSVRLGWSAFVLTAILGEPLCLAVQNAEACAFTALAAVRKCCGLSSALAALSAMSSALLASALAFFFMVPAADLPTCRVLALAAVAHLVAESIALLWETSAETLLLCFAVDDAAHRTFAGGNHKPTGFRYQLLQLSVSPAVQPNSSHGLWSSIYTPACLRHFLSGHIRRSESDDDVPTVTWR